MVVARQPQARLLPLRRARASATTTSRSNQTQLQPTLDTEAFPTAGTPNPVVDLFVYDVATQQSVRVDVRDGKPFDDDGGRPLRLSRAVVGRRPRAALPPHQPPAERHGGGRRQPGDRRVPRRAARGMADRLARRPSRGCCSSPTARRFIWESQRNGWNNFYLYDLGGRLIAPLTSSTTYEADKLVKIDEQAGVLFYTARDGDNPLKLQLHRVGLDGTRRSPPDRPGVSPHRRQLHPESRRAARAAGAGRPLQHRAGQRAFRRRLPDARHAAGGAARRRRRRPHRLGDRQEPTPRGSTAMGLKTRGAVHVHGRRRHDDAARDPAVSVARSIRRRRIRCWSRSTAGRSSTRSPRARPSSRRARSPSTAS